MTTHRATRVAVELRAELARSLLDLADPRLTGVIISNVEMTPDLQIAKIYVRSELGADTPQSQNALLSGLQAASGRLRKQIAKTIGLRVVPTLRFIYDKGPDAMRRIEEVLQEIKAGNSD